LISNKGFTLNAKARCGANVAGADTAAVIDQGSVFTREILP